MPETITSQIAGLQKMSVAQLREKMQELTGEPCRQTHRRYLIKRLAFVIQEKHYGGVSEEAKEQIAELRKEFEGTHPSTWFNPPTRSGQKTGRTRRRHGRDPRLPQAGTIITRHFKGHEYKVEVLDKSFLFEDQPYKSLSAVAQEICGTHINGFSFFRLNQGSNQ